MGYNPPTYMFRPVSIDVEAVAQSLSRLLGRAVSEVDAIVHLRREGFIAYGDGWLSSGEMMAALEGLMAPVLAQAHAQSDHPTMRYRDHELSFLLASNDSELRDVG